VLKPVSFLQGVTAFDERAAHSLNDGFNLCVTDRPVPNLRRPGLHCYDVVDHWLSHGMHDISPTRCFQHGVGPSGGVRRRRKVPQDLFAGRILFPPRITSDDGDSMLFVPTDVSTKRDFMTAKQPQLGNDFGDQGTMLENADN